MKKMKKYEENKIVQQKENIKKDAINLDSNEIEKKRRILNLKRMKKILLLKKKEHI